MSETAEASATSSMPGRWPESNTALQNGEAPEDFADTSEAEVAVPGSEAGTQQRAFAESLDPDQDSDWETASQSEDVAELSPPHRSIVSRMMEIARAATDILKRAPQTVFLGTYELMMPNGMRESLQKARENGWNPEDTLSFIQSNAEYFGADTDGLKTAFETGSASRVWEFLRENSSLLKRNVEEHSSSRIPLSLATAAARQFEGSSQTPINSEQHGASPARRHLCIHLYVPLAMRPTQKFPVMHPMSPIPLKPGRHSMEKGVTQR